MSGCNAVRVSYGPLWDVMVVTVAVTTVGVVREAGSRLVGGVRLSGSRGVSSAISTSVHCSTFRV